MPSHQAQPSGLWDAISGAASAATSAAGSLWGMGGGEPDYSMPVIGPNLDELDGYMPNPDGGEWYGLPYPDDLYGEDNGDGGGGMPFGLLDDAQIEEINEAVREAGGGPDTGGGGGGGGGMLGGIKSMVDRVKDVAGDIGGRTNYEDMVCY